MALSEPMMSFDQWIAKSGLERREARTLLGLAGRKSATWLIAHGDETVPPDVAEQAGILFERRRRGEPMAYLVGEKEFLSRSFRVGPGVLIPRPETELLVAWGLECLKTRPQARPVSALDLGCGSGCVGLSLWLEARGKGLALDRLTLSDVSAEALEYSKANARNLGLDAAHSLRFCQGSWFGALPPGQGFDLILSNPPYIRQDDVHLSLGDLRFEPAGALGSGAQGMDAIDAITREAVAWLVPGGWLMIEHGYDQAALVQDAFGRGGFESIETRRDLAGHPRLTAGRCSQL